MLNKNECFSSPVIRETHDTNTIVLYRTAIVLATQLLKDEKNENL